MQNSTDAGKFDVCVMRPKLANATNLRCLVKLPAREFGLCLDLLGAVQDVGEEKHHGLPGAFVDLLAVEQIEEQLWEAWQGTCAEPVSRFRAQRRGHYAPWAGHSDTARITTHARSRSASHTRPGALSKHSALPIVVETYP